VTACVSLLNWMVPERIPVDKEMKEVPNFLFAILLKKLLY